MLSNFPSKALAKQAMKLQAPAIIPTFLNFHSQTMNFHLIPKVGVVTQNRPGEGFKL